MTTKPTTDDFLQAFLTKAPARSSQSIKDRMLHWQHVANNPGIYLKNGDVGKAAEAARKKVAMQSLRKLIDRNPEIAAQLLNEQSQEAA
jgi:hypothetical protein